MTGGQRLQSEDAEDTAVVGNGGIQRAAVVQAEERFQYLDRRAEVLLVHLPARSIPQQLRVGRKAAQSLRQNVICGPHVLRSPANRVDVGDGRGGVGDHRRSRELKRSPEGPRGICLSFQRVVRLAELAPEIHARRVRGDCLFEQRQVALDFVGDIADVAQVDDLEVGCSDLAVAGFQVPVD